MLTKDIFKRALQCTQVRADEHYEHALNAIQAFGINTAQRLAMFLAQVGHESGSLVYMREVWGPTSAQVRYEGRKDLGNTQPGDGKRFSGHGPIQVTGRDNHARMRDALRKMLPDAPDFEADPERLCEPRWGWLAAGMIWQWIGGNELADNGDFLTITKKINGGYNGLQDRKDRLAVATAVLGIENPLPSTPATQPEQPVAPLLMTLGSALINAFTPLAAEKINKELARHTDKPEVAEQVTGAIIETVKAVTGKDDPIEAVAAAKADPSIMQQAETSALDALAKLEPMLEKLHVMQQQSWAAEEISRDAAAKRASTEPWDMSKTLVLGALGMIAALMLFIGGVAIVQAMKGDIKPEVWAQIAGLVGFVTGVGTTIYAYRFGSSRNSAAKDVVIAQMQQRR